MTALAAHALLRNATKGKRDQMQALPCKLSWVIIYNNYIRYEVQLSCVGYIYGYHQTRCEWLILKIHDSNYNPSKLSLK